MDQSSKQLRILYAAGPGNVIGTYNHWSKGEDDPSQVSVTYSSQFYDVCQELNAQGYIIASHPDKQLIQNERFILEHRPIPLSNSSGILYHLGYLWYGIGIIITAVRFNANVAVIANGTTHWFILSLLPLLGIKVIPSLHCVLWQKNKPKTKKQKFFLSLDKNLLAKNCLAILSASDDIENQVKEITQVKGENLSIVKFFPTYRKCEFIDVSQPDLSHSSRFQVLYVGRIEKNKGVFDLLEIAKNLSVQGNNEIYFDLCGNGTQLQSLIEAAKQARVNSHFICHGHCNKEKMRTMFSKSHVIIVPTTSDFIEGFNQVVVEGILVGRPVITSSVCPALSYVKGAVLEAQPDDINSYQDAIVRLFTDFKLYEEKRKACINLQEQFYDDLNSWKTKLKSVLIKI